ncbi:class I SAM-dependent methyltransferase [Streptomyces mirabilis]|uniref:class I SAM-dependent methyltransferase n=1 Tax=Streptomyces mirabilis TaxID=68239 RepID=UPI003712EEF7
MSVAHEGALQPGPAERPASAAVGRPTTDLTDHLSLNPTYHQPPSLTEHPRQDLAERTAPAIALASPAPSDDSARPWSGDPYSAALRTGRGPLFLRSTDGWLMPLEVERWCAGADAADLEVLRRCEGVVLDVGCGPGRLVAALAAQGRRALGIDVSEAAIAHTARLGGQALRRSVFEPLPGEGHWDTALLVDGNLGIGGDPRALLRRMAQLLAPDGLLIAETVPVDVDERVQVRVADGRGAASASFPWARLGTRALLRYAHHAGWRRDGQWSAGGRSFVALRNRSDRADLRERSTSSTAEPPNSTAVTSSQRARKPSPESPVANR